MQRQLLALATAIVTLASAIPKAIPHGLNPRGQDYINNSSGNLQVLFSDETVSLGALQISTIMDNLGNACHDDGICVVTPITLKNETVKSGTDGEINSETVTITPGGSYPTWLHNGLLEVLGSAIKTAADCSNITNTPNCAEGSFTVTECTVPKFWGVVYETQEAAAIGAAPFMMHVELDVAVDTGLGFCDKFFSILGPVAGAVTGVGGLFSLIGLACESGPGH